MRKYGVDKFFIRCLEEVSDAELSQKEQEYTLLYNAYTEGYNMTPAGESNPMDDALCKQKHDEIMRSEAVREKISIKMSEIRRNQKLVLIHKEKSGKRIPYDQLELYLADGWELGSKQKNMITIHLNDKEKRIFPDELELWEEQGWQRGGKLNRITPSQRAKLDASHQHVSEEFRKAQSERLKNYYANHPEALLKHSYPVELYNGVESLIFCSVQEAGQFLGYSKKAISYGVIGSLINCGYVKKEGPYKNWKIRKLQRKGGDEDELSENALDI